MKRRAWLSLGAVALLALAAAWVGWQDDEVPAPEARLAPEFSAVSAPPLGLALGGDPSPLAVASAAPEPAFEQVWDLCGLGRMPFPGGTMDIAGIPPELPDHLGRQPSARLRDQVLQRLAAGSPRERAAALMLAPLAVERDNPEQQERSTRLAELARGSSDAVLLHWALNHCRSWPAKGCEALSPDELRRLEPGNAAVWLQLLDEKTPRSDELIAQMPALTEHKLHYGTLAATIKNAIPAGEPEYLQLNLLGEARITEAMVTLPNLRPITDWCRGAENQSACRRLAEVMTERADTLLVFSIGARVGEMSGWPTTRVQALRDERDKLSRAVPQNLEQPYSCRSIEQTRNWIDRTANQGELALLRELSPCCAAPPQSR